MVVYRARRGPLRRPQWRWRIVSDNNRRLGHSGESYNNKDECIRMAERIALKTFTIDIEH